ncbi:uncharacterized protein LOC131532375 isoform X1 [Onychostoma macrolepis]|uniref:uncharacterized protein LOC131532375 isoform X1 n=1 Tax=Onychostoma macrolepis TaxID=369639 RepID=UPI0027295C67|nr:uncharacterized protein LOC131532375 isoform X1 [Onychostoma macrolepis]
MRSLQIILLLVVLCLSNFVASADDERDEDSWTASWTEGVVRDSERVAVRSGEHVTLFVKTPGNLSKVKLQKSCENEPEDPIIRYCSPEEKNRGCSAKESERFSIKTDTQGLSVTFVDARVSDEGCYVVSYIDVDDNAKKKLFNVTVHDDERDEDSWTASWTEGAVRDSERVEVRSGEHVTLFVKTPGNVSKVKLQKAAKTSQKIPLSATVPPKRRTEAAPPRNLKDSPSKLTRRVCP